MVLGEVKIGKERERKGQAPEGGKMRKEIEKLTFPTNEEGQIEIRNEKEELLGYLKVDRGEAILVIDGHHRQWDHWREFSLAVASWIGPLWVVWPNNIKGNSHVECFEKNGNVAFKDTFSRGKSALNPTQAVEGARIILACRQKFLKAV